MNYDSEAWRSRQLARTWRKPRAQISLKFVESYFKTDILQVKPVSRQNKSQSLVKSEFHVSVTTAAALR